MTILDLTSEGKQAIRVEYSNTLNFCDGDIFRHLRHCNLCNEFKNEQKWLVRLSESKRKDVKQLQKMAEKDEQMKLFRDSLDKLIPITGLWPALKIGTFHRLLSLRCPEELCHYLLRIKNTWDYILNHDTDLYCHDKSIVL